MIRLRGKNTWIDQVAHGLHEKEWDLLIVPSQVARDSVMHRVERGLVPRIVTYDQPMGYQYSVAIPGCYMSKEQATAWIMDFLHQKRAQGIPLKDSAIRDLSISFWALWEHMDAHNKDWSYLTDYEGAFLGGKKNTIDLLKAWAQWWPGWVCSKGGISRSLLQQKARQSALASWARHESNILCVVDSDFFALSHHMEQWIGDVCSLPYVQSIVVPPVSDACVQKKNVEKIECASLDDKARTMALSIVRSCSLGCSVAIRTQCSSLLKKIGFFLKKWDLDWPISDRELTTSFLQLILRWAAGQCSQNIALDIAYHPFTRRFYPIAPQMGAWIRRHYDRVIQKDFVQWVQCGETAPLWAKRSVDRIQQSVSALSSRIKKKRSLTVSDWVRAHVDAFVHFMPDVQKDTEVMDRLFDFMQSLSMDKGPMVDFGLYKMWFDAMFHGSCALNRGHPDLKIVFQERDMRWVDCDDCLHDGDQGQDTTLSWIPRTLKEQIGLHTKSNDFRAASSDLSHTSFSLHDVCYHADPAPSLYQQWSRVWLKAGKKEQTRDQQCWGLVEYKSLVPPLKKVSISDIQSWVQDPDLFYKGRLLKIRPVGITLFQQRGLLLHRLLDSFVGAYPPSQKISLDEMTCGLIKMARPVLASMPWWKESWINDLCSSIAHCEYDMRQEEEYISITEAYGYVDMDCGQTVRLTARADRIDFFPDRTVRIIDYKTGTVPPYVAMDRLQSVQLPLEGLMAQKGAFTMGPVPVRQLCWWHLSLSKGCVVKTYPRSVEGLIEQYDAILPVWMQAFATGNYGSAEKDR